MAGSRTERKSCHTSGDNNEPNNSPKRFAASIHRKRPLQGPIVDHRQAFQIMAVGSIGAGIDKPAPLRTGGPLQHIVDTDDIGRKEA